MKDTHHFLALLKKLHNLNIILTGFLISSLAPLFATQNPARNIYFSLSASWKVEGIVRTRAHILVHKMEAMCLRMVRNVTNVWVPGYNTDSPYQLWIYYAWICLILLKFSHVFWPLLLQLHLYLNISRNRAT